VSSESSPHAQDALEAELAAALDAVFPPADTPPKLREAARMAVLAGGHRVRPALCMAVSRATGDRNPRLARAYGVALELAHAASLVHDDLPAFDDAPTRRGRPSIHAAYGEATAVLVGDALIVASFDLVARTGSLAPEKVGAAVTLLAGALGGARGLVAGQAWESEPSVELDRYQRAKTSALFEAASCLGALASGEAPEPLRAFGEHIGLAYQTADDLVDVGTNDAGKPLARDAVLGRPNAAHAVGETLARAKIARLLDDARAALPPYVDRAVLLAWLADLTTKLARRAG